MEPWIQILLNKGADIREIEAVEPIISRYKARDDEFIAEVAWEWILSGREAAERG